MPHGQCAPSACTTFLGLAYTTLRTAAASESLCKSRLGGVAEGEGMEHTGFGGSYK